MTEVYSTDEWWGVGTVSLQNYAFNIATLGGSRLAPPPLRGADILVPYRPGQVALPRIPDARTITLGMWVQGCNEDGSAPTAGQTNYSQFMYNWRKLRSLLWQPSAEFSLTKRFYNDAGTLVTATAKARFAGGLEPVMMGEAHGVFTVDLLLADPFFYGVPVTQVFSANTTHTLVVPGDYMTFAITLVMAMGARFTNMSLSPYVWCQLSQAGTVDVKDFVVTNTGSADGLLTHGGASQWFVLNPGSNTIILVGSASTLTYQPVYI